MSIATNTVAPGERWEEFFELPLITSRDFLLGEVEIMEQCSEWIPGTQSKALSLIPIAGPIMVSQIAQQYKLEYERTYENATEGTRLILDQCHYKQWNISNVARGTLYETAKLQGSALGRMAPEMLAETLNNGLAVARGTSLLLVRHGKIMALHSDAAGGYCPMPISQLIEKTEDALKEFGSVVFRNGYHSNSYTAATWMLPDAKGDLLTMYQDALKSAASNLHAINFTPAVRFSASDTARSSAVLKPVFMKPNGTYIMLGKEISVKHEKSRNGIYGLDLFEQESKTLFAKFKETAEVIEKMANTEIENPVNCFVGIMNHLNRGATAIPRKYADAAREEVEMYAVSSPIMSMHDIYLSMSECVSAARNGGASKGTVVGIEDAIAKVLTLDWKDFDIGGVVAWGEKGAR